jgi:PAS domain S-box-containing protein
MRDLEITNHALKQEIAECRQSYKDLESSELRFRSIFEHVSVGLAHVGLDGQFFNVNRKFCDITGYSTEDIKSLTIKDFVQPKDAETDLRLLQQLLSDKNETYSIEKQYCRRDSTLVWISLTISFLYDEAQKTNFFLMVIQDSTGRKQTEETLHRQHDYLQHLFSSISEAIVSVRLPTRTIEWISDSHKVLGYTPGECMDQTSEKFYSNTGEYHVVGALMTNAIEKGQEVLRTEALLRRKNGEVFPAEINASFYKKDGKVISVTSLIRDITQRRQAEDLLRDSEEKFRNLVEQSPLSIQILNLQGQIISVNESFKMLWGISDEDLPLAMEKYNIFEDAEVQRLGLRSYVERAFGGEAVTVPVIEYDAANALEHLDLDAVVANKRWIEVRFYPIRNSKGEIVNVVGIEHDVTAHNQAEEKLRIAQERFYRVYQATPNAITIVDLSSGQFVDVNKSFERIFGYSKEEVVGRSSLDIKIWKNPEDRARLMANYSATRHMEAKNLEFLTKTGETVITNTNFELIDIFGKDHSIAIVADITRNRQAEKKIRQYQERLKALASQLTLVEERERSRIAGEMHDSIGQTLAFSRIQIAKAKKHLGQEARLTELLDDISQSLFTAIQQTKNLVFDLSSPLLNEIGLPAAIANWLEEQVEKKHGIETVFIGGGENIALATNQKVILFRNFREILANTIKHAEASRVVVMLKSHQGQLILSISDNGVGFDVQQINAASKTEEKFGLFGIKERMEDLGGALQIIAHPGRGSRVVLTAPSLRRM